MIAGKEARGDDKATGDDRAALSGEWNLASAWTRHFRADDFEPVTTEWLEGEGFARHEDWWDAGTRHRIVSNAPCRTGLERLPSGSVWLLCGATRCPLPEPPENRYQMRCLMRVLGLSRESL